MIIEEEDYIEYNNREELSYYDTGGETVELCVNGNPVGRIKVWLDSQMDNREYICLNYTIVYLDTLKNV